MPGVSEQDNKDAEKLWMEATKSKTNPLLFTIQMSSVVPFSKFNNLFAAFKVLNVIGVIAEINSKYHSVSIFRPEFVISTDEY